MEAQKDQNLKLIFFYVRFGLGDYEHDVTLYICGCTSHPRFFFHVHIASCIGTLLTEGAKPILPMGGLGWKIYTTQITVLNYMLNMIPLFGMVIYMYGCMHYGMVFLGL